MKDENIRFKCKRGDRVIEEGVFELKVAYIFSRLYIF